VADFSEGASLQRRHVVEKLTAMGKRGMSIWVLGWCGSAFIDVDTAD